MMQVLLIALVGAAAAIIFKKTNPETSMLIGIITGIIILYFALEKATAAIDFIKTLSESFNIGYEYIETVLKIIGITYIGEFAVSSLKDAGESGIATKVEIFAKLVIVGMAIPVLMSLVERVSAILI